MLLEKTTFSVNDNLDFVEVYFGNINARIGYRLGLHLEQLLRLHAKNAARVDRVKATFTRQVDVMPLDEDLKVSRVPQQSQLVTTVKKWQVADNPPLVRLMFDGVGQEMDYETAVKLANAIRRASRRAKAWAGDTSKIRRMMGNLTNAEEDYKLGIA